MTTWNMSLKKKRQILSNMSMIHFFCKHSCGNFEVQRYFFKKKLFVYYKSFAAECSWILSKEALKTAIFWSQM